MVIYGGSLFVFWRFVIELSAYVLRDRLSESSALHLAFRLLSR